MSRLLIRERARICKWLRAPTAFARRPGRLGLPPLSGWDVLLSRTAFTACRPALGQLDAGHGEDGNDLWPGRPAWRKWAPHVGVACHAMGITYTHGPKLASVCGNDDRWGSHDH